jgi:GAF domain-containing protein
MAAFAVENINYSRYYVHLDSAITESDTDHALLLDAARDLTESDTAIIYSVSAHELQLRAIAARSDSPSRLRDTGVTFSIEASRWLDTLSGAVQGAPRSDPHFEKFPEALQYQTKRLIVVPLRSDDRLLGILTVGRSKDLVFGPADVEVAQRAGRLLTAILERDALQQKLVERKLVERAKGILQQRRRLSEEEAYLMLRTNSRRRRIPMVSLAKEIIEAQLQSPPLVRGIRAPQPFQTA